MSEVLIELPSYLCHRPTSSKAMPPRYEGKPTNSFTAYVGGGYQTQTVTAPDSGAFTVNFATYAVTVHVVGADGNPALTATVTHAGNTGVFSSKAPVDSSGTVTYQALPGTSTFTAWIGANYRTGSLTVSGATDFYLSFYVA